MTRILRYCSLIGVLMLGSACSTDGPTAPGGANPPTDPTTSPTGETLPPGEPIATYVFDSPLDAESPGFMTGSRYLLYEHGAFALAYDELSDALTGTYRHNEDTITFWFDGNWWQERGDATGTVKGDLLEVRYIEVMQQSDFENAVYRRLQ